MSWISCLAQSFLMGTGVAAVAARVAADTPLASTRLTAVKVVAGGGETTVPSARTRRKRGDLEWAAKEEG